MQTMPQNKDKERTKKVRVRFKYSNGHYEIREFPTWDDAVRFGWNEGDHCLDWEQLNK